MSRLMSIAVLQTVAVLGLLALAGPTVHAQQFSAEVARRGADNSAQTVGKLAVSHARTRIETPDFPEGFFLLRDIAEPVYFVMPARQVFMEAGKTSALTELWLPVDPDNPCRSWQAMASRAASHHDQGLWQCEPALQDPPAGDLIRYRIVSPSNQHYSGWISQQLRFLVRLEVEGGDTLELINLDETAQPERLFEIPAGYAKFDPKQLIERIKKSDVWVEPMK